MLTYAKAERVATVHMQGGSFDNKNTDYCYASGKGHRRPALKNRPALKRFRL